MSIIQLQMIVAKLITLKKLKHWFVYLWLGVRKLIATITKHKKKLKFKQNCDLFT